MQTKKKLLVAALGLVFTGCSIDINTGGPRKSNTYIPTAEALSRLCDAVDVLDESYNEVAALYYRQCDNELVTAYCRDLHEVSLSIYRSLALLRTDAPEGQACDQYKLGSK